MSEITLTSEIAVKPIQSAGGDHMVVAAARVSTSGESALQFADPDHAQGNAGLINYLMKNRHGTPFEHASMTFFVHAPMFVWWEWVRHRVGWCLAGDSKIWMETISPSGARMVRKRTIAELYRNWHVGIPDANYVRTGDGVTDHNGKGLWRSGGSRNGKFVNLGYYRDRDEAARVYRQWADENPTTRTRLLPSCRNLTARVLNEETHLFGTGRVADIYESGIKEIVQVDTSDAKWKSLRCSRDHRLLTPDGWARAGDLSRGDSVYVVGRRNANSGLSIPPSLRRGIGVWTSMQRKSRIKPTDRCYICGCQFDREDLQLDHVVPVMSNLAMALDVSNLAPACKGCHRMKSNSENSPTREMRAGSKLAKIISSASPAGEEMTYDISMGGDWHNFVANGIVVHNSYNLESSRYKVLDPVFWIPRPDRKITPSANHKPSRPEFVAGTEDQYRELRNGMAHVYGTAYRQYRAALDDGIAGEVARAMLPQAVYFSGWVTCNPRSLMAFLSLRTHEPDATFPSRPQAEIEEPARVCESIFLAGWPISHGAFCRNGRVAP